MCNLCCYIFRSTLKQPLFTLELQAHFATHSTLILCIYTPLRLQMLLCSSIISLADWLALAAVVWRPHFTKSATYLLLVFFSCGVRGWLFVFAIRFYRVWLIIAKKTPLLLLFSFSFAACIGSLAFLLAPLSVFVPNCHTCAMYAQTIVRAAHDAPTMVI